MPRDQSHCVFDDLLVEVPGSSDWWSFGVKVQNYSVYSSQAVFSRLQDGSLPKRCGPMRKSLAPCLMVRCLGSTERSWASRRGMTVTLDGHELFSGFVSLPPAAYLGFYGIDGRCGGDGHLLEPDGYGQRFVADGTGYPEAIAFAIAEVLHNDCVAGRWFSRPLQKQHHQERHLALTLAKQFARGEHYAAAAQSKHPGDIALTYDWVRSNTQPGNCGCFGLNGGGISASVGFTPHWLAVADFSAGHQSNGASTGTR